MSNASQERIYNFSAGPAVLPVSALEEAQRDMLSLPGQGMSVVEMSHRSKGFTKIIEEAEANILSLLGVKDGYQVLFLQGGASLQFSMLPMNFLRGTGKNADYIMTGSWASKALKEAKKEGAVREIWSGKADNYVRVPAQNELELDPNAAYVHMTANETIQGIEFSKEPETGNVPLICDASSNFLSKPLPVEKYAIIYAGAQKNVGPSGVTVVLLRKDMLDRVPENLPSMLDFKLMAENKSLYNTPCTFGIYMIMLVTRWLMNEIGGLVKMAEINKRKARMLYDVLDGSNGFYRGHSRPDSRSMMNVTWRLPEEALEQEFIKEAESRGLNGLKGHRSVGGIRASIYNAMPEDGVTALRDFMEEFMAKHRG